MSAAAIDIPTQTLQIVATLDWDVTQEERTDVCYEFFTQNDSNLAAHNDYPL